MAASKDQRSDDATAEDATGASTDTPEKLNLAVDIAKKSACERHVTVTIPREDIERYFDNSFSELMGKAEVPGFAPVAPAQAGGSALSQGRGRAGQNVAAHGQHDAGLGRGRAVAD